MHALADPPLTPRARARPTCSYGQTTSLCETCLELVPAKIIGEDGKRLLPEALPRARRAEDPDRATTPTTGRRSRTG